jgi:tetratricopeptide (TPR) repeat protein
MLELEDVISEQVTKQLVPRLTGEERVRLARRGTNNPAAYEHYLQGRYFWNQFLPSAFLSAVASFENAIAEDPNYALAYVGMADYYTWSVIYGMIAPSEGFPKVRQFAARALELDPLLAEAHAAMGLYHSNMQRWDRSEEFYRRAIDLNPNYGLSHEWLSATLVGTGRFQEGRVAIETAERLDPLSLRPKVLTAWTVYQTRDFERALAKGREIETLDPEFMQTHLQLANILLEMGEIDDALKHARRAVELEPESPLPFYMLCWALAAKGSVEEAREIVETWASVCGQRYVPPYFLAIGYLSVGETERALENIEAAVDEHSPWALWLATEPKLDRLRDEPRFVQSINKLGLPLLGRDG